MMHKGKMMTPAEMKKMMKQMESQEFAPKKKGSKTKKSRK